jgi:hypothetical protein
MHDPLTSWKMSANKKAQRQRGGADGHGEDVSAKEGPASPASGLKKIVQDDDSGGINVDASFVRSRVREKLEGWDRGELLSVEGQVCAHYVQLFFSFACFKLILLTCVPLGWV